MKRKLRILRIWFYGKLPYAKKYRKWLNGTLFRGLQSLHDVYSKQHLEKYGSGEYEKSLKQFE